MDVKKPNTKLLSTIFGNWSSDGQEPMRILSKTPFSPSQQSNFHQFSLGHLAFSVPSNHPNHPNPPHPLVFVQLYFSFSQVLIRHAAKLDRDQNWISLDPCFATARVQAAVQILSNLQDSSSLCQCHPFFSFFSIFERFRTLDCLQNSTGLSWQSFLEGRTSTVSCPAFRICSW